ncbi:MAG: hypothetical protein J4G06_03930 [Caldilineaceae bacterium]|nr:hypothetical protein [Caldilineaceae bacterium]
MKTAIREDMHPASNGRVGELHPDADPTMTRAAREERAADGCLPAHPGRAADTPRVALLAADPG